MRFAHISDFHIFADKRETALVRHDAVDAARKVVADLASLKPAVDAVIFTGDLTDCGSTRDYALLLGMLALIKVPIFAVPGNHDRREAFRTALCRRLPFEDGEFLHYETIFSGMRILGLDTIVPARGEGRLCDRRQEWVASKLQTTFDGPTIIAMHHPPFKTGITSLDGATLVEGSAHLGNLVRRHRNVRILCGHIHRPVQAMWNGAFSAIGGGPSFQIALDLTGAAEEPPVIPEPYAYFIHELQADGDFVVHTRYVSI